MKIKKGSKLFRLLTFTLAFIIIISGGAFSVFAEVPSGTGTKSATIYAPEEESEPSLNEIDSETIYVPEEESESSSDEISGNISSGDMTDIISPGGNVAEINGIGDASLYQPIYSGNTYVIENGVYAFENVGNVGLWMDTQYSKNTPGYHIQQYALTEDPTVTFTRSCLFKITQVPGTNRYVIRSMLNNRLTFNFSGNEVLTKEIPPSDVLVPEADTFTITYSNGYVVLKPYGSTYTVAANNTTASGSSGAPNSYLAKRTEADAGTRARWYMHKYTGGTYSGVSVTATPSFTNGDSVAVDTTSSLKLITWTTQIGANTPYLEIHPDYTNMATFTWNDLRHIMTLNTQKVGTLRIRAIIREDGTDTNFRTYACYYTIVPDVNGRTVCVKNAGTGRYFDIEGNNTSSGADIQQYDFTGGDSLFWTMTLESGGYFTIKSNYSNKYIGVESTNTTLVRQYSTQSDYTKWKIIETSAGNYKFVCKAIESSGLALAVPLNANSNGTDLNMITYTDNTNYRDEWDINLTSYSYTLNNYYDQGYNIRFSDSTTSALQKIQSYNQVVADVLYDLYGINVVSNYYSYTSSADTCKVSTYGSVSSSNLYIPNDCPHITNDYTGHFTRTALQSGLSPKDNITSVIAWTGHILPGNPGSVSFTSYSVVITPHHMTDSDCNYINNPAEKVREQSINSLLHEVSHQLGAHDHNCKKDYVNGKCSNSYCDICVKGFTSVQPCTLTKRWDVEDQALEDLHCAACKAYIRVHIEQHH